MPEIKSALPLGNRRSQYGASSSQSQGGVGFLNGKPPKEDQHLQPLGGIGNTTSAHGGGFNQKGQLGGPSGSTPRNLGTGGNSNYRRAFKPQLTPGNNTGTSGAFSTLNSEDRVGGGGPQGSNHFYENPI